MSTISRVLAPNLCVAATEGPVRVLACTHVGWFEEGPVEPLAVAEGFVTGVQRLSAAAALDAEALASLVRSLLAVPQAEACMLSFCVVEQAGHLAHAYSCGAMGLLGLDPGRVDELLPPQTLDRKLRRDGLDAPPGLNAEAILAQAAGPDCTAGDLCTATLPRAYEWLATTDDPRLAGRLLRTTSDPGAHPGRGEDVDVRRLFGRAVAALAAHQQSFLAWRPSPRQA